MKSKSTSAPTAPPQLVDLGENPVNAYQAREYAKESSPSIVAVIIELTENARDNATDITLTIDVGDFREEKNHRILIPRKIICEDNGTGLTHREFLEKFCGAFSESESHHEVDRAGRNGVGTKTYTSIADKVIVRTTTGRATEGLTPHHEMLGNLPKGLALPSDGEADTLWRVYDFRLHKRGALPAEWTSADAQEMGTRVELLDLRDGAEIDYDVLIERLSYPREWLHHAAHSFTIQLTGNVPTTIGKSKILKLKAWSLPEKPWLAEAKGRSDEDVKIFDPTTKLTETVGRSEHLHGVLDFDFRVVGRNPDGQMQSLNEPALLLEICGALPYAPNLEGVLSARTLPLLTFSGREHASSIGAFCNAICGWARINSLPLKAALRNNKTTLASGPGTEEVQALRDYLYSILGVLHKIWYNATRAGQDEAAKDALKEATEEVNLALKGVNRNPFKVGDIVRDNEQVTKSYPQPPTRRHRWECGSCGRRWLAVAGFTPKACAESDAASGPRDGCSSTSIGLAKNQPRIGDCEIRIEQLGDSRIPANFQFDKRQDEDEDVPVVRINVAGPRYVELRGPGSMSAQAQKRLKQYLVDMSLVAIAEYNAKARGSDFSEELGELYFNRMLRVTGIREYDAQVAKILEATEKGTEQAALAAA